MNLRLTAIVSDRLVNQVHVNIIKLQLLQRTSQRRLNILRTILIHPEFCNDENILSFELAASKILRQLFANFSLILINCCSV